MSSVKPRAWVSSCTSTATPASGSARSSACQHQHNSSGGKEHCQLRIPAFGVRLRSLLRQVCTLMSTTRPQNFCCDLHSLLQHFLAALLSWCSYRRADVGRAQQRPVGVGVIQAGQGPSHCTTGTMLVLVCCDVQVVVRELTTAPCNSGNITQQQQYVNGASHAIALHSPEASCWTKLLQQGQVGFVHVRQTQVWQGTCLPACLRANAPPPLPPLPYPRCSPWNFWQLKPPPAHCSYAAMWLLLMVAAPHVLSLLPVRKSGWCRLQ